MTTEHLIEYGNADIELNASPVRPSWILEGNPIARSKTWSTSADGTAFSVIWDCSAGRFNWFYNIDETVYILQGSVTLKDSEGVARLVKSGDTVFFPAGSRAEWTVHEYVKKVAFLRSPLPVPLAHLRQIAKRLIGRIRGNRSGDAPRL